MKRLFWTLTALPLPALAHGGHWHLDEETLAKIFGAVDAVYAWFAANSSIIATGFSAILVLGLARWWHRRPSK